MSSETIADAEGGEQQELDYSQETLEQLEQRMASGEGLIVERDDEEQPEPTPEPQEEPEQSETSEGNGEAEQMPVEEAPQEQEEEPEPEFDEQASRLEEMRLMVEQANAQAAKAELERGRATGQQGHLMQEIRRLREQLSGNQAPQDDYQAEAYARPQAPEPTIDQTRLAELENTARETAINSAYVEFTNRHGIPAEQSGELLRSMADAIREGFQPYETELGTMQPKSVKKVLSNVLESAYVNLRLAKVRAAREEALQKRASQVPEKRQAKLAASVSGSGAAPPPKARPKSPDKMTAEEADAALIREFGDGHHRRRIR